MNFGNMKQKRQPKRDMQQGDGDAMQQYNGGEE